MAIKVIIHENYVCKESLLNYVENQIARAGIDQVEKISTLEAMKEEILAMPFISIKERRE